MNIFIIKIVMNSFVILPFLMIYSEAAFSSAIMTTLALALLTFLIGDQMLLRITNNMAVAVADAGMAYLFIWAATAVGNWKIDFAELVTVTILYGFVETMFHRYLRNSVSIKQ